MASTKLMLEEERLQRERHQQRESELRESQERERQSLRESSSSDDQENSYENQRHQDQFNEVNRWRKPTEQELLLTPEQFCPILCRETPNWVITSCGHCFDEEALSTWLSQPESVESCPICRKPFREFDRKAQREVAHSLVICYLNYISAQYKRLWESDKESIINRFWDSIPSENINGLMEDFRNKEGVNVSAALKALLEPTIKSYVMRLHAVVHDIVLKDINLNLNYIIPLCYRSQLNKDSTIYIAYSLTRLVPEFHVKWWKNSYLLFSYAQIEEMFLAKYHASLTA